MGRTTRTVRHVWRAGGATWHASEQKQMVAIYDRRRKAACASAISGRRAFDFVKWLTNAR